MSNQENGIYKLNYRILAMSSADATSETSSGSSVTNPQPVINFLTPWSSKKFCAYPQKIILKFDTPVNIQKIHIISHENRISQRILFSSFCPQLDNPDFSKITFDDIGYINFNENSGSNYQVREFKKIFINIKSLFMRMELDNNYINEFNPYHQIGLVDLEFFGTKLVGYFNINISLKEKFERMKNNMINIETRDNNDEFNEKLNEICGEQIRYLNNKLMESDKNKNLNESIKIKDMIQKVRNIGKKIYLLEKDKVKAVEVEDFDKATDVKDEIDKLKMEILNLVKTIKKDKSSSNSPNKNINNMNNNSNDINNNTINLNNSSTFENNNIIQNTNNNFNSNNNKSFYSNNNNNNTHLSSPEKEALQNNNNIAEDMNMIYNIDYDNVPIPTIRNKVKKETNMENLDIDNSEIEEQNNKENLNDKEKEKVLADLTKEQIDQFSLIIQYINITGLQKLLSKYIKYKLEGIEILRNKLSDIFISKDLKEIIPILFDIISNLLEDTNFKSLKTFELIEQVFQYLNINKEKNLINNDIKNFIINRVLERIINFMSDGDKIIRKKAKELYISIIKQNIININTLLNVLLSKDINNKDNALYIVSPLSILSKLKIIKRILLDYQTLISNKIINEQSFNKDIILTYIMQYLFYSNYKVKEKSRKICNLVYEVLGPESLMDKIYNLNQNDFNNLLKIKELENIMNYFNSNKNNIMNNKKNKKNLNTNLKECNLCKENLGKSDMNNHIKVCKMYTECDKCKNFIEIKNLTKHRLNECKHKNEFKQCDRCKEAINSKEYDNHVKIKKCNIYKSNYNRCPLCHKDILYGNKGFYRHLMIEGCEGKNN